MVCELEKLKVLNDAKLVLNELIDLGPIWYHLKTSDIYKQETDENFFVSTVFWGSSSSLIRGLPWQKLIDFLKHVLILILFFEFQIQRLAREERDMLTQQVNTLSTQVEAQNQVVRKLEEKERLLQTNLAALDKELSMRQQAMEMHKRKAIESAQSAADLKLHLEKYHAQIKEMQITVADKTSSLEAEAFKTKRLQVRKFSY